MKLYSSKAIIMRVREFGESDLLVTFFTPDRGQLKGVAKGARRSRKRFVNCLDLFSLVNLEYSLKKEGALHFLNSGKLLDGYQGLRTDYANLSRASYMIELAEILFPNGVADSSMFNLLKESFDALAGGDDGDLISIIFEAGAMALGGYSINLGKCCFCERTYTGEGMAVFRQEKGGISCLNCSKPSDLHPQLTPDSVELLYRIQTSPFCGSEILKTEKIMVEEIKHVLRLHRDYRLEKRLRSVKYIE